MSAYELAPITVRAAKTWVEQTHRHLPKVQGALFAAAVRYSGRTVGVATAGNPARVWQGTGRFVISRCAVLPSLPCVGSHPAPACTMLYGAMARAGKALGYREAWTYTLPDEHGRSLVAAGFLFMGFTRAEEWDRPSRARAAAVSADQKARWARGLNPIAHAMLAHHALDPAILLERLAA